MRKGVTDKERQRSAAHECQALREIVSKLRQELLQSEMETQKVKDQLQCLIYLVRKSWQGDTVASIHVAKIVGVAPPVFKNSEKHELTATTKTNAICNWAKLSLGLLNRCYMDEELELRAKQLMYLQGREELLDEQLHETTHKDAMRHQENVTALRMNTLQLIQAKEEEESKLRLEEHRLLEKQKQELQGKYKRKHPHGTGHLYQRPRKDSVERSTTLDASENLFVKPVTRKQTAAAFTDEVDGVLEDLEEHDLKTSECLRNGRDSIGKVEHKTFTRRRSGSFSQEDVNREISDRKSKHVRSLTADGPSKNSQTKPRPRTAGVKSSTGKPPSSAHKNRPVSAYLTRPKSVRPPPTFDTSKTKRQLDLIDRDLKLTTKTLQERLGISRQGLV